MGKIKAVVKPKPDGYPATKQAVWAEYRLMELRDVARLLKWFNVEGVELFALDDPVVWVSGHRSASDDGVGSRELITRVPVAISNLPASLRQALKERVEELKHTEFVVISFLHPYRGQSRAKVVGVFPTWMEANTFTVKLQREIGSRIQSTAEVAGDYANYPQFHVKESPRFGDATEGIEAMRALMTVQGD